jgi:hypothetical protein
MHDHCSPEGARALKRRIELYWAERGHIVEIKVSEGAFADALRGRIIALRSDMTGGLPRDLRPTPRPRATYDPHRAPARIGSARRPGRQDSPQRPAAHPLRPEARA